MRFLRLFGALVMVIGAGVVTADVAAATRVEGDRQDMDPYFFGVDAAMSGPGAIVVSGPCEVDDPPGDTTIIARVTDDRGNQALGTTNTSCLGQDSGDRFQVDAAIRGRGGFTAGDEVTVCAHAHVSRDSAADVVSHWCTSLILS